MPGGGIAKARYFSGPQRLVTVDDLEAFVRRAASGESFVYCEAPDLIRSPTSARVATLADEGLVRPHRRRREGGGWTFTVVRTGRSLPESRDPVEAALADPATDIIFRALKRAANFELPCPTDTALAVTAGLSMRQQAGNRVRKLIELKLIRSELLYDGGVPARVVTVLPGRHAGAAAGKRTALPGKWAALQSAAAKDAAAAEPPRRQPGQPSRAGSGGAL